MNAHKEKKATFLERNVAGIMPKSVVTSIWSASSVGRNENVWNNFYPYSFL